MIVLMVGSTIGYAISLWASDTTNVPDTDGQPFFNGNSWIVPYGGGGIPFQSSPQEARNVSMDPAVSQTLYQGSVVYVAAESPAVQQQLQGVLGLFAQRVQLACYGPCSDPNLPEVGCDVPLVVWNSSDTRAVHKNESCVFIEGDYVAVDAFLYRVLGHI